MYVSAITVLVRKMRAVVTRRSIVVSCIPDDPELQKQADQTALGLEIDEESCHLIASDGNPAGIWSSLSGQYLQSFVHMFDISVLSMMPDPPLATVTG